MWGYTEAHLPVINVPTVLIFDSLSYQSFFAYFKVMIWLKLRHRPAPIASSLFARRNPRLFIAERTINLAYSNKLN